MGIAIVVNCFSRYPEGELLLVFMESCMAKKREQIKMQSSASPHRYYTVKNKTQTPARIVLKKYDPTVRQHVEYKEVK